MYAAAGTFVAQGPLRSCTGDAACSQKPIDHEVMNVLAFEPQMLVDTPSNQARPRLTNCWPLDKSEPVLAKAMLVPFSVVLSDDEKNQYGLKGLEWMIDNSPLVRVERVVNWTPVYWGLAEDPFTLHKAWGKGIKNDDSETFSKKTGVSMTGEFGFEFKGISGKVSATVSKEFGYAKQHSVSQFQSESWTVDLTVPAGKAAAVWREESSIAVKVHNRQSGLLETIDHWTMFDSFNLVQDSYGPCEQ